jgi:hypothetical protein
VRCDSHSRTPLEAETRDIGNPGRPIPSRAHPGHGMGRDREAETGDRMGPGPALDDMGRARVS